MNKRTNDTHRYNRRAYTKHMVLLEGHTKGVLFVSLTVPSSGGTPKVLLPFLP